MSESLAEMPSQPGLILKSAREEMSLSLEQVAHELHLRPAVVRAIEEENYEEFSSDVFLKGYFRTYCRLVNLHETRMMNVLEQQLLVRNQRAEHEHHLASKKVQARKRKRLFITIAVLCVCISLIAFAYQMTIQSFGVSDNQNQLSQSELVTKLEAGAEDELAVETPQSKLNEDADTGPAMPKELINDTIPQELNDLAEEKMVLSSVSVTDPIEPIEAESSSEEFIDLSSIKALFSGDCWFKVTDITGKNVIADLKKNNDEVNFKGSAPFHVVIGDASKVSLFFEEKLVNLRPYTSPNGRAELTLKPSVSINQG